MNCACHGEPMLWNLDSRYLAGGFFRCRMKNRERIAARYAIHGDKIRAQRLERYDTDPVYRIGSLLANAKRQRALTLQRRREALAHG